ncbi:hypothetical protein DFH06DRAFT_1125387 [Mycena polygramma]|nr:hypothetical protein DFH06DRAFT_1125387 [Mycena polygramma]
MQFNERRFNPEGLHAGYMLWYKFDWAWTSWLTEMSPSYNPSSDFPRVEPKVQCIFRNMVLFLGWKPPGMLRRVTGGYLASRDARKAPADQGVHPQVIEHSAGIVQWDEEGSIPFQGTVSVLITISGVFQVRHYRSSIRALTSVPKDRPTLRDASGTIRNFTAKQACQFHEWVEQQLQGADELVKSHPIRTLNNPCCDAPAVRTRDRWREKKCFQDTEKDLEDRGDHPLSEERGANVIGE